MHEVPSFPLNMLGIRTESTAPARGRAPFEFFKDLPLIYAKLALHPFLLLSQGPFKPRLFGHLADNQVFILTSITQTGRETDRQTVRQPARQVGTQADRPTHSRACERALGPSIVNGNTGHSSKQALVHRDSLGPTRTHADTETRAMLIFKQMAWGTEGRARLCSARRASRRTGEDLSCARRSDTEAQPCCLCITS